MALDVTTLLDKVTSHAATLGYFDRINTHEPKNAPGNGLSASVWFDQIEVIRTSGLASSSAKVTLNIRLATNMIQEPQDMIDTNLVNALNALMAAYHGDFELGSQVRMIDVLGAYGTPLSAQAGYLNQDNKIYRVFTIKLPLIVNDVWDQTA